MIGASGDRYAELFFLGCSQSHERGLGRLVAIQSDSLLLLRRAYSVIKPQVDTQSTTASTATSIRHRGRLEEPTVLPTHQRFYHTGVAWGIECNLASSVKQAALQKQKCGWPLDPMGLRLGVVEAAGRDRSQPIRRRQAR